LADGRNNFSLWRSALGRHSQEETELRKGDSSEPFKQRSMNIGLIGPGEIGAVIVRKLRDAGYPVKMANSKGPDSLRKLATVPFERNAFDRSCRPCGPDHNQPCWRYRSIGLRSRHQRAPRRIGERAAYFAHRCEFVPISRLVVRKSSADEMRVFRY
jgi:F420-dependent NADP oxidoreductase-like protein